MEQKRTYEEAVKIMVDWWAEKSFGSIFNQHNGASSYLFYRFKIRTESKNMQTERDVEKVLDRFLKDEQINHSHHGDKFEVVQNNWLKFVQWCNSNLERIK